MELTASNKRLCVEVPERQRGTFMAIPLSPTSDKFDLDCQVVINERTETGQCIPLQNRCANRFTDSIYTNAIEICKFPINNDHVCFSNITREMDNTKFHFYYSLSFPCFSRVYIASYKLILEEGRSLNFVHNMCWL